MITEDTDTYAVPMFVRARHPADKANDEKATRGELAKENQDTV